MRSAWPYFVPAWLYLPFVLYVIPAFRDVNENLLACLLVGPQVLALLVLVPLRQGRIAWRDVELFLVLPFVVVVLVVFVIVVALHES